MGSPAEALSVVAVHRAQPADHRHLSDGCDAGQFPGRPNVIVTVP
jgi:hypothetical protein